MHDTSRKCCKVEGPDTLEQDAGAQRLSGLPQDLLRESTHRLGTACLIYAAVYFLAYFVNSIFWWIRTGDRPDHLLSGQSIVAAVSILLALGLFALIRQAKLKPCILLDLGLGFEVIGALGIASTNLWGTFPEWSGNPYLAQSIYLGIPWECVWIVVFPMLAPNTRRKSAVAAFLAASMGLLVVVASRAAGATSREVPLSFFVTYFLFTSYICALLAVYLNHWTLRYKIRIKQARELGQYTLEDKLGEGGMGEVWRATHRLLARPAAIKLIRPQAVYRGRGDDSALLQRFQREAKATAALSSVHTIGVHDFGTTDDGSFYYVMELLDGLDLDSFVERFGPVPPGRAIFWLRQACHSLAEAHDNKLVHRDVKPANLFVCRLGPDRDFIKVLDFGLVKRPRDMGKDLPRLTQQGISFGTPDFMPPEMATGEDVIDGRADIYALGCVGYWLVTGVPVFTGNTPLATVLHHVNTEPTPPSQSSEQEIPADFEQVILACLSKRRSDRPRSARELDERLAACSSAADWDARQAEQWWDLHLPGGVVA